MPVRPPPRSPARERRDHCLALGALALAAFLAYANSLRGPFVFDDRPAILANPTLDRFSTALSPPRDGGTVAGRPLVNLSLALNRAISGTEVWSYHALNVLIHICAGLVLFGVVRRTIAGRALRPTRSAGENMSGMKPDLQRSNSVAFSAALLWAVHPLTTAAVTYVIQRAESLMALCFLLTLYCLARSTQCHVLSDTSSGLLSEQETKCHVIRDTRSRAKSTTWAALSALACVAGMACKEVMVVAPLVVLLYDWTFVAGSFGAALRARRRYYAALASTWLLLAWLVITNAARAGTAGFGGRIGVFDYAVTQCAAIVTYLRLTFWPTPLVFDHGISIAGLADAWPHVLFVLTLLAAAVVALRRRSTSGFLGAAFFLVLAPSSSFVPIHTQTIAEHRMYLPLAIVTIATAAAIAHYCRTRVILVACLLAMPLAAATHFRNRTYASAVALWTDTIAKRPDNPRAHNHLAVALVQAGRTVEAIPRFEAALRLAPDDAEAHNNLANALAAAGRADEALAHHEAAARLNPKSAASRLNFANALLRADRPADAVPHFAAAVSVARLDAGAHYNYGVALTHTRQFAPAIAQFRAALQLDPEHVGARVNLANALLLTGRTADAIAEYEAALRLQPDDPQARANLARARALGR